MLLSPIFRQSIAMLMKSRSQSAQCLGLAGDGAWEDRCQQMVARAVAECDGIEHAHHQQTSARRVDDVLCTGWSRAVTLISFPRALRIIIAAWIQAPLDTPRRRGGSSPSAGVFGDQHVEWVPIYVLLTGGRHTSARWHNRR